MAPTYEELYLATERGARVWAWRFGASTAADIDEAVNLAWLHLLEARPEFVSITHGAVYLRRCVFTATKRLLQPTCEVSYDTITRKAPMASQDIEKAVWEAGAAYAGWDECSQRERFALVLTAAGWSNKEIMATAPRLYPRPNAVAYATWRARVKLRQCLDIPNEGDNGD